MEKRPDVEPIDSRAPGEVYTCRAPSAKTLISGRLAAADEATIPRRRGGGASEGGQLSSCCAAPVMTRGPYVRLSAD